MKDMTIHILQVLSGECIIVDFENGKCILVDGGYKRTYPKLKKKLIELNRDGKRLEYVILTHYDEDHIAGLIKFFKENGKKGKEKIIPVDNTDCRKALSKSMIFVELLSISFSIMIVSKPLIQYRSLTGLLCCF